MQGVNAYYSASDQDLSIKGLAVVCGTVARVQLDAKINFVLTVVLSF